MFSVFSDSLFQADIDEMPIGSNPIHYSRSLSQLSQAKLARTLQISRSFLIRVEQGCYKTPGSDLTNYAAEVLSSDPPTILNRYELHQRIKRELTISERPELSPITGPVAAPNQFQKFSSETVTTRIFCHDVFREWREDYWDFSIDFCTSMCIHPDTVKKYESGEMLKMPEQLQDVLRECNLIGNMETDKRWYYV